MIIFPLFSPLSSPPPGRFLFPHLPASVPPPERNRSALAGIHTPTTQKQKQKKVGGGWVVRVYPSASSFARFPDVGGGGHIT